MLKDTFANRLKKIMLMKNIKASEVSAKTGIAKSQISHWLAGTYKAKQDTLTILADFFGVNEVWLMGFDVPMDRVVTERIKDSDNDLLVASIEKLTDEQKELIKSMINQFTKADK